jgi:hypothetical protein
MSRWSAAISTLVSSAHTVVVTSGQEWTHGGDHQWLGVDTRRLSPVATKGKAGIERIHNSQWPVSRDASQSDRVHLTHVSVGEGETSPAEACHEFGVRHASVNRDGLFPLVDLKHSLQL